MTHIDFLVIGHVSRDITPRGHLPGGAVTYGSITARNLGSQTGLLTRARQDSLPESKILQGISTHVLPSETTTTFENRYQAGQRTQILHACADPITSDDVPEEWLDTRTVLLGPIAQEVDVSLVTAFPHALLGATIQGWMREWDSAGRVTSDPNLIRDIPFEKLQVVFLSEEDIAGNHGLLAWLILQGPIVIVTDGQCGSTIYQNGETHHIAPRPAHEVDPTGAGDVFATACILRLSETHDIVNAARFANVAASFSVEAAGPAGVPDRQTVLKWMEQAK